MLRSGLILCMAGPAALLTMLVHPMVRDGADFAGRPAGTQVMIVEEAPVVTAPTVETMRIASVVRSEGNSAAEATRSQVQDSRDKASSKLPRRLMKEGCEGAISSLAGPEARRMLPGRCIA